MSYSGLFRIKISAIYKQKSNDVRFWRDYFILKLCISKKSKWKVSEILLGILFLHLAIFCIFLVMWVSHFPRILSQIIAIWCRNMYLTSQYVLWISFYFLILLIRWKDADFKKDERFCDFLRDAKCSVKIYPENKKWQCYTSYFSACTRLHFNFFSEFIFAILWFQRTLTNFKKDTYTLAPFWWTFFT